MPELYDSAGRKERKKVFFLQARNWIICFAKPFLFEMAVTHSNREIMLEVQGANILTEILNKSEI